MYMPAASRAPFFRNMARRMGIGGAGAAALLLVLGAAGGVGAGTAQASKGKWLHLFHVGHDESPNVVQYDMVVDEHCKPVGQHPIKVYWRLTRKKSTRPLNMIEKRAYGVGGQARVGDGVRFHVAARPKKIAHARPILRDGKCQAQVWTSVKGKKAILEKAWIRTAERSWWRLPDVLHVDLFARLAGGESIFERVIP